MLNRSISSVIFCTFLLSPILTHAGVFSQIKSDFPYLKLDLNFFQSKHQRDTEDKEYEFGDELFPKLVYGSGGDTLKGSAPADSDENLSITIDGQEVELSDVLGSAWFAPYIQEIAEKGVISGYRDSTGKPTGFFGPADNVTIEQLAKIAMEASDARYDECGDSMKSETAIGRWSEDYIKCAEYLGWAVFSDGSVDVTRPALRNEVIVTVLQAFEANFKELTGTVFSDVTAATEFAVAIETAARDGLVSGFADEDGNLTGLFGPSDPVTRAEIAKIVGMGMRIY
ncbi:S-layer homology domain-containing protein [Patescibacteria group bacterium]|nr:S-layer homology domain-containing protein [Patescibacteria group bacterium]MBU1123250.1 S-layer homology domain-containing protein [Patescibacteria group bacterium]